MINTVLGPIKAEKLGVTLMHEHMVWDWAGTRPGRQGLYTVEEAYQVLEPYLKSIKDFGCSTLVEASTYGTGRDVRVLKLCAERTGLNIVTNCGMWDGGDARGGLVPKIVRQSSVDEIAHMWVDEFENGIDGTDIKPGFIKLALGDEGHISELQEKALRAACRTSLKTGLVVQCHATPPQSAKAAVAIAEEEQLPLDRFIWVHCDFARDMDTILELGRKGIWLEIDYLARVENFEWHVTAMKELIDKSFTNQLLLAQDAGSFGIASEDRTQGILPYDRIFAEFIPQCVAAGISEELLVDTIMTNNAARALTIRS